MTKKQEERQEAIDSLRNIIKAGDTVYTNLVSVSRSGMSRKISIHIVKDGQIRNITYNVGKAIDYALDRERFALKVGGCGMDMGFSVVYSLSRALFPDGFKCAGGKCSSNDHFNGVNTRQNFKGKTHKGDGGYALSQSWL